MAEDVIQVVGLWRKRVRRLFVIVAVVSILITCLGTAVLVIPEIVLTKALYYEIYNDQKGVELGLQDLESLRKANPLAGGGSSSICALDAERRWVLVTVPYVTDKANPEAKSLAWGLIDTEREAFVASLRVPSPVYEYHGVRMAMHVDEKDVHLPAAPTWVIHGTATLPGWWPDRSGWEKNGPVKRSDTAAFEFVAQRWRIGGRPPEPSTKPGEAWLRRINRSLLLPQTSDEIVAEHVIPEGTHLPMLVKLLRRSKEDGTVRWQIGPEQFRFNSDSEHFVQLHLPVGPLESPVGWCCLVEQKFDPGIFMGEVLWRLDIDTGHVRQLEIPIEATPHQPQVASDGQTVAFIDQGVMISRYAGGGSSQSTGKTTDDILAWHPELGMRSLWQWPHQWSSYQIMLPRGRVLAESKTDTQVRLVILPLDGGKPRQVFP